MKRYKYLLILIAMVVGFVLLFIYRINYGHIRDTNGSDDYSLQEIDLSDTSNGISDYTAWIKDVRQESNYSLFSSRKVTGIVTLRTVTNQYITFDVDVKDGNCEIVVMDYTRTIIHTVDIDGRSSVYLPETSNYYYVVMGVESADVTVTVTEN
jgi:hypothetical protein